MSCGVYLTIAQGQLLQQLSKSIAHIVSAAYVCPKQQFCFFMSKGTDYLIEHYNTEEMAEPFPSFLNHCPIWEIKDLNLCFMDGGRGAPQAVDTVETLAALGVKNIIAVGMCGAYDENVRVGEIIAPKKAFVEEGTSLHYYESIEASYPNCDLLEMATALLSISNYPIVSSDAVARLLTKNSCGEKKALSV